MQLETICATTARFSILAVCCMLAAGCGLDNCVEGSGSRTTQDRTVAAFDQIKLDGDIDLVVRQDTSRSIRIEADDNLLPYITTTVSGTTLAIGSSECLSSSKGITVHVSMPAVTRLVLDGSGNITSPGILRADLFKCELEGSGDIDLHVEAATSVMSNLNGSGDIRLRGHTPHYTATLTGSGDIEALDMDAEGTIAWIDGSGDATVAARKSLTATVSGSGTISYKGDPEDLQTTVSGSGRIIKLP